MGWNILKRKPHQFNDAELIVLQRKADMIRDESAAPDSGVGVGTITPNMHASGAVPFEFTVLDDETIHDLVDPSKEIFHPLLLPLLPLLSRLNFLTSCTEREAFSFKVQVDVAIARLKNKAQDSYDFMLLDNMRTYLHMRVNDSVLGFKVLALTERRKRFTYEEEKFEQKGLLKR